MIPSAGQIFIAPLAGKKISAKEKRWLSFIDVGGVILFRRNIDSPRQLFELCRQIHDLELSSRPFIAIDHEGGAVHRLPPPYTHLPDAAFFGKKCCNKRGLTIYAKLQRRIAQELLLSGINLNFAPVVDVLPTRGASFMQGRSYSRRPRLVGQMAKTMIRTYKRQKLIACAKHFPGHGATKADSHLTLPRVNRSLKQMGKHELAPYRQVISAAVPMIMTAHIIYKDIDPNWPATFSSAALQTLLRRKLGFRGLIVSDDMEMKAASKLLPPAEVASQALLAGCDVQIFGRSLETLLSAWRGLSRQLAQQPELAKELASSIKRVGRLKKGYQVNQFRGDGKALAVLLAHDEPMRLLQTL